MAPKFLTIDAYALVRRPRVLVVDPDQAERERFRDGLEPRFWVTLAADADEAVARLRERYFDAILTSYELGERDGVWLLRYVFESHRYVHRTLMAKTFIPGLSELLNTEIIMVIEQKPLAAEHYAAYFAEPWVKAEEVPDT
jgi:CheY-like chemotaxis protein